MTARPHRGARALAHLAEIDPALGVLALWCTHRDGDGPTRTDGQTIRYGPGFADLALPEQVGLAAHHVLHVALRHGDRQAAVAERLGDGFDGSLFGLAADGIVNDTLLLGDHALPRPAVTLTDLLREAGRPAKSAIDALADWDVERLAMFLHSDPERARKARDWGKRRGFAEDLGIGQPEEEGEGQSAAEWRNQILRAFEAGRKAGTGIGKLGAVIADITPARVPWEVHLRGLLARALSETPTTSHRRPSSRWVAMASAARQRGGAEPVFEPGRVRTAHRPRIVIGLDTSSSIDAQTLRLFTAEIAAITRRSGAEVHLLAFDEAVFLQKRLDPDAWAALRHADLRTGGGTDYGDLFAKAAALSPSMTVVLTDLDAEAGPPPRHPVLWAVPGRAPAPPFGKVLEIGEG